MSENSLKYDITLNDLNKSYERFKNSKENNTGKNTRILKYNFTLNDLNKNYSKWKNQNVLDMKDQKIEELSNKILESRKINDNIINKLEDFKIENEKLNKKIREMEDLLENLKENEFKAKNNLEKKESEYSQLKRKYISLQEYVESLPKFILSIFGKKSKRLK